MVEVIVTRLEAGDRLQLSDVLVIAENTRYADETFQYDPRKPPRSAKSRLTLYSADGVNIDGVLNTDGKIVKRALSPMLGVRQ